jgi:hypothetical protein
MNSFEELRIQWLTARRKHGVVKANEIIRTVGGVAHVGLVPPDRQEAVTKALAELDGDSKPAPKTLADLDAVAIFAKWNAPRQKEKAEPS